VLYDPVALPQLLSWADPKKRPDLAIVLVDEDGKSSRKTVLEKALLEKIRVPHVVAVAIREFEAWLIADAQAIRGVFGPVQSPSSPEDLECREAKAQLMRWIQASRKDERDVRLSLAQSSDLETLRLRCSAFRTFYQELAGDR
jgi:hypothetical protein